MTPNRAASRTVRAACAAASNALLGTQPVLRQSPPMRPRSISATRAPSCAAPAATDSPAAPAPMTARSKSMGGVDPAGIGSIAAPVCAFATAFSTQSSKRGAQSETPGRRLADKRRRLLPGERQTVMPTKVGIDA